MTWGQKRGWNICESLKSWRMTESVKDTQSWISFQFFVFHQFTVKVDLLKPTTPKNCIFMPFFYTNSHLATKPYNFWHQVSEQFWKLWLTRFLCDQIQGWSEFFIYGRRSFQQERVLWGWLAGPSHNYDGPYISDTGQGVNLSYKILCLCIKNAWNSYKMHP